VAHRRNPPAIVAVWVIVKLHEPNKIIENRNITGLDFLDEAQLSDTSESNEINHRYRPYMYLVRERAFPGGFRKYPCVRLLGTIFMKPARAS
jgi:hypothetical protein